MQKIQQLLADWGLQGSPLLQALVIVVVAVVAAWVVDFFLCRVLGRWARHTSTDVDDSLIELFHRPVRTLVVLLGLGLATQVLGLPTPFEGFVLGTLKTVAILVALLLGIRFSGLLLQAVTAHEERLRAVNVQTLPLINNLVRVLLVGGAIYFVFLSWSIDVTAWLASAGIIGVAVGFAAKDTLANLFAGVFISTDAPYKLGDFIILDTGERGRVTQIGIRSTRLLTRDDIEIIIPNAIIANAKIVNESGGPWEKERVRVKVGVAYGSDIDRVKEVLLEVARGVDHICPDPNPRVRFRAFGESSLDLELLCWIDEPVLRGRTVDDLNSEIYKRFQREGIQIPFPQRDVHLFRADGPAAASAPAEAPPAAPRPRQTPSREPREPADRSEEPGDWG